MATYTGRQRVSEDSMCISTKSIFFPGSRRDMERAIKNGIALAPDDNGYILSSGCEVPAIAPPQKVAWFMEVVNELCVNA